MPGIDKDAVKRIEALLESHGADARRWPAAERERFSDLLTKPQIVPMRREAAALDALLDRATMPEVPAGAMGRLMAKVEREAPAASNVIKLLEARRRPPRSFLPAVSALAASLLVGIYLGASGLTDRLLQVRSVDESFEVAELDDAVVDEATGFLEEDEAP